MAIPLKRAKRRAQRARRRAHQHAPQADWVVWDGTRQLALSWHLRIDTEQFQQQLRPCGLALQDAANAMHRVGDVGVATATALQGLHAAIDRANRRDRLAVRIAATSLMSVREALDLVAECEKHGIAPEWVAELSAYGLGFESVLVALGHQLTEGYPPARLAYPDSVR